MTIILPSDLPPNVSPVATDVLIVEGSAVNKSTIAEVMTAGRPFANQSEAEIGTGTTQTMNPLTTAQAMDFARTQAKSFTALQTFSTADAATEVIRAVSTSDTATAGPDIALYRNRATPAANDTIGRLLFIGEDSAGNEVRYAQTRGLILDPTSGSDDSALEFVTRVAGANSTALGVANGVVVGAPTGSYKGAGTVNSTGYYLNGSALASGLFGITPGTLGLALLDDADAAAGRTTLGLGTIATQASSSVTITGGSITGITDLAVADGGTGASTAASARTNLGAAALAGNTFTGVQLLPVGGSEAAPTLSFAGDTDTGIYRAAANDLGIATGGFRNSRFINTGTQQHFLTQVAGGRFEIQKHSSPTSMAANDAAFIVQSEQLDDELSGGIISGLIYAQMHKDADGLVSVSPDGSSTVWCGIRAFVFNTGDGSTNAFSGNVTVNEVGATGYNEGGGIVIAVNNHASTNAILAGAEILLQDSNDGGATDFDTAMNVFNGRMTRWNNGSELCSYIISTHGGAYPADTLWRLNPNGFTEVKTGLDWRDWTFTTGIVAAFPNNTAISWENAAGSSTIDILKVDSNNDVTIKPAGTTRSVLLNDGTVNRLTVSSSAINIRLPGAASLVAITAGAADSGGSGFKVLRIPN